MSDEPPKVPTPILHFEPNPEEVAEYEAIANAALELARWAKSVPGDSALARAGYSTISHGMFTEWRRTLLNLLGVPQPERPDF